MHWWKKFLSNFFSDKTMDEQTEWNIENNPKNNEKNNHKNEQHEMKTRMIYQYPKGEFRFPLIKDQPGHSISGKQKQPIKRQPRDERRTFEKKQNRRADRRPTEQTRRKIEPQNSQPFEPTHIPSPIYGFNRPIERKVSPKPHIPEFELKDIQSKLRGGKAQQEIEKNEKITEKAILKDQSGKHEIDEIEKNERGSQHNDLVIKTWEQHRETSEGFEEKTSEILQNVSQEQDRAHAEDNLTVQTRTEMDATQALVEEIDETANPLSSEESRKTDDPVFTEELAEPANPASTGEIVEPETQFSSEIEEASFAPVFIKESDEAAESANGEIYKMEDQLSSEEPEIEGMALKQSELNAERELIDDLPLDDENEKAESESSSPEAYEEMAVAVEMTLDQEDAAEESSSEELSIVEESAKEGSDSKPRSNLPFNVLMLTQDKTNWKKQSEREKNSSEAVSAPVKEVEESETPISETVHYTFPDLSLLKPPVFKEENTEWLNEQTSLLDETMENFNVKARVVKASQGPSVTRFEVQPDKGVKVNKITNLSNDIKLSMAARDIRMEAPIPGTRSIGIELPNKESRPVQISEIIGKPAFLNAESPLTAALGLDISGEPVVTDLRKMPHGLIAGATGSGKSVCINSILVSLLYKARPDELKLMLIDPKMVELAPYNHIPHLVSPVITDVKAATAALKWAVDEMERRYELFVHAGVRDIGRFNELAKREGQKGEHLPYIVIIIDELADLMMVAPAEVEESICRIAQKARACGIHLLIATQRPSVDVITGLIKANVPTRIAFAVSSQVDSRTVIDVSGAEKLLGRGDMLFLNNGSVKPVRLQGTFVSDEEIDQVIDHVRDQGKPNYIFQQEELLKKAEIQENEDELLLDACQFVVKQGNASTSLLQRQFRIGYNRAARLMEMMEDQGVISGSKGSKPRDVLIKEAELDLLKDSLVH